MIQKVYTHCKWWMHLDELFAFFLLEKYQPLGFEEFKMEDVIEITDNELKPWHFAVGIGRGELDDKNPDGTRKDKCVAILVAEKYNLNKIYPEIITLLSEVDKIDLSGPNGNLSFGHIIANIADVFGKDETINIARQAYDARIKMNWELFHNPLVKLANKIADKYEVEINNEKKQIIVFELPDSSCKPIPYAFWQGAACAIIYNIESGNVQVLGDNKKNINLEYVFNTIVETELTGSDRWYFHPDSMVLNGSETHKGVLPTQIPLETIIGIVCRNIQIKEQ